MRVTQPMLEDLRDWDTPGVKALTSGAQRAVVNSGRNRFRIWDLESQSPLTPHVPFWRPEPAAGARVGALGAMALRSASGCMKTLRRFFLALVLLLYCIGTTGCFTFGPFLGN